MRRGTALPLTIIPMVLAAGYLAVSILSADLLTRAHNHPAGLDPRLVSPNATAWSVKTEDNTDIGNARTVLDADHHGLNDVKDRIVEYLAVRSRRASRGLEADRPRSRDDAAETARGDAQRRRPGRVARQPHGALRIAPGLVGDAGL